MRCCGYFEAKDDITLKQANGKWMDIGGVGGMVLTAG
jgi:hypothetical protein